MKTNDIFLKKNELVNKQASSYLFKVSNPAQQNVHLIILEHQRVSGGRATEYVCTFTIVHNLSQTAEARINYLVYVNHE